MSKSKTNKYFVNIETLVGEIEVFIYAESLLEATERAEAEYSEQGFLVTRVRPEVIHHG